MTVLLGVLFAAGVLLTVSPWLWPRDHHAPGADQKRDGPVRTLLAEAGAARLGSAGLVALSIGSGLVASLAALAFTRLPVLGLLAAVAGLAAPVLVLRARRAKRIEARRAMWPDVCDLLVASVRSGMGLPAAVASLADNAPSALRAAFADFRSDLTASGHFDSSVLRLKAQLADATADRILETLRMARQVGGTELPTVLRTLSASVRAEVAVRGEVAARQSWIRGAAVVGAVAPWAILGMLLLRPEGVAAYSTPGGIALVVVAAVVSVVAFRLMARIGRLPAPRRWFG